MAGFAWQGQTFRKDGRQYLDPGRLQQLQSLPQRGGHDAEFSTCSAMGVKGSGRGLRLEVECNFKEPLSAGGYRTDGPFPGRTQSGEDPIEERCPVQEQPNARPPIRLPLGCKIAGCW